MTTSSPPDWTCTTRSGRAARLRSRKVSGEPSKYSAASSQTAQAGIACGRPSARTVLNQYSFAPSRRSEAQLHGKSPSSFSGTPYTSGITGLLTCGSRETEFMEESVRRQLCQHLSYFPATLRKPSVSAARHLSILLLLQVHRRLTSRALAERLEVSMRTVHRDMDALSAAGVPVYAERGATGGWLLDETFRTGLSLNGLTPAEAEVVFLGTPARLLSDLGLQGLAASALEKILLALPGSQRQAARSLRERIHVDPAGWRRADEVPSSLASLQDAVFRERRLRLVYERADGK